MGKKRKKGALIWPVGTWALKAEFYAFLRKDQPDDGAEIYPSGYVHIAQHNDERWCRQVVAENLKERESKGRKIKEWVANGDNHFHDCRIYAMALMVHEAGYWTEDQWKLLAQQRGVRERPQGDLFAKPVAAAPAQTAEQAPAPAVAPAPAAPPRKRTSSAERIKNMFARDRY
jgi:phage terminase large subunit GpA-like protein